MASTPTSQDVIVVLDFGKPDVSQAGSTLIWGTRLLNSYTFVSTLDIRGAAVQFADGFMKAIGNSNARLWLEIGLNNFQPSNSKELTVDQDREHGRQWAHLVYDVEKDLRAYAGKVFVDAANDIEFAWSDKEHGIAWIEGYREGSQGSGNILYDFGSCDGCYPIPGCDSCTLENNTTLGGGEYNFTWPRTDALYAIRGTGAIVELPEIYHPSPCLLNPPCDGTPAHTDQAKQWTDLSLFSATNVIRNECYGNLVFEGSLTQWRAAKQSNLTLMPDDGWEHLWAELNSNACTTQAHLDWSSDIQWQRQFATPVP